ncbi:MAG: ATP synthase F0 subunit B [Acidobacteriota bacterium]
MKRFLLVALLAAGTTLFAQEAAQAEHEGGKEEKAELVVPDSLKWANFAILAIGLGYMLIKLLPKNFAERTAFIQKEITEAQAVKRDAEQRAAAVDARLKALGSDIEQFRIEAGKEMAHEGERIQKETAALIEKVEQHSAVEIESAGKLARRELRQYSAELALKLAEERVRAKLDASSEAALVDGFVADLGRQRSKN